MEKFDYKQFDPPADSAVAHFATVLTHADDRLAVVLGVVGENASLVARNLLQSLEKLPWHTPRTLDTFLQNSLKLARHKNYTLTFAIVLQTIRQDYFYTADGAIILLRGKKSGRLLASQEYATSKGDLLDNDQLLLSSDRDQKLVTSLRAWLLESTQPTKLLKDKRDFLLSPPAAVIHLFPAHFTAIPSAKKSHHLLKKITTRFTAIPLITRLFKFVKNQQNHLTIGLVLLIIAGVAAVVANYHSVGQTLQTTNTLPIYTLHTDMDAGSLDLDLLGSGDATLFHDLTLALTDFSPQTMTRLGNTTEVAFLDAQSNQVLIIDLPTRRQRSLDLSPLPTTPRDMAFFHQQLVFLTNPLQAYHLPTSTWQTISPSLPYLDTATTLASFGNFLYAIYDRQIYRLEYDQDRDFQYEAPWLHESTLLPASPVTSFTINRSIFVSTYAGDFNKYEQGRRLTNFALELELSGDPIYTYANLANTYLYVLQPATSQVFITDNDGNLITTLTSEVFARSSDILVVESLGRLYVLAGHLIYTANLPHL